MKTCHKCGHEFDYFYCKKCKREYDQQYRILHPGKKEKANKLWRQKNTEKMKLYMKEYRAANKSKYAAYYRTYVINHPDCYKKATERVKKSRLLHPHLQKIFKHNRRAKIKNTGILSPGIQEKLFKLQKGKCPCCTLPLGENFHLDHIIPLSRGGTNTDKNVQLLRAICNNQKYNRSPIEFMQSRGCLI